MSFVSLVSNLRGREVESGLEPLQKNGFIASTLYDQNETVSTSPLILNTKVLILFLGKYDSLFILWD